MPVCSICLNEVRETRHNKPIRCGHLFHASCLEKWKTRPNGHTCPLCRAVFDVSKFTINLQITNNYTSVTSNILTNEDQSFRVFDVFELNLDMDEQIDLDELFADLNIDISDLNPAVFDTAPVSPSPNSLASDTESATEL